MPRENRKNSARIMDSPSGETLQITISGKAEDVRAAIHSMRFRGTSDWTREIARDIALKCTNDPGATVWDKLDQIPSLQSDDARQLYRQACCDAAGALQHPVNNPSKISVSEETRVLTVGDSLYDNAL